jgi:hypothetical protein
MMTLDEYMSQESPIRNPKVMLSPSEYTVGVFIGTEFHKRALVHINGLHYEYVVKECGTILYTSDGHGNPVSMSVFHLPEPATNYNDHEC